MDRILLAGVLAFGVVASEAAEKPTQFWNLTSSTVVSLRLSHAGSGEYGDNVAVSDPDGVDHDERLKIESLPSGRYDLELKFKGGRVCFVRNIAIVTGKVFSVEEAALVRCTKK